MTRPRTPEHRSAVARFFRNPTSGELAVVQAPNLPLAIWLAATLARLIFTPDGGIGSVLSVVGTLSLVVWAVWEVARGDSPFRRVLGGLVLASVVLGLLVR